MSIWQAVGFHMVIWLGLQTISTLYEAAEIEGSSKWQAFRYVTWLGSRNTAILILIVITMQCFAVPADRRDDQRRPLERPRPWSSRRSNAAMAR
ncbi:MAG: hypothetical protein R3D80_17400 [Paracoccaceae bacterium]